MKTIHRFLAGTLAAVTMAGLAGCSSAQKAKELEAAPLPSGGSNIEEGLWTAADAAPAERRLASHNTFLFPLPLVSHKNWFEVGPDRQKAVGSHTARYGLGVPYEYLPLINSYSKYVYERGTAEPVGSVRRRSNPFFSWAGTSGNPGPELEVEAKGIPLFAEWGHENGYAWYFDEMVQDRTIYRKSSFFTSLWSLGPASFKVEDQQQLTGGQTYSTQERYFYPLFLGKLLGVILWSDYSQKIDSPKEKYVTYGHGPLLGYPLWYTQTRANYHPDHAEGNQDQVGKVKMVLGGLGYFEFERGDNGEYTDKVKGPLWGLFGTGIHKGEPVYYLFRIPVKKGGGGSEPEAAPAGT